MAQLSSQDYTSFTDIKARLEQIITSVKDKEVSLENSLDLFDEAIKLGSRAVDMVDAVDLDDSELVATDAEALPHKNTSTTDVENDTSETDTSSDDTPVAASSKNDTSVSNELESSAKDTASSKVQPNSSESEASQHGDVQVPVLSAH
ncbi:exodeoxyribonuclease VII small subunit [Fannyhessea vaginae]|uniref:exodeoxyribonuclease VII small subunit n=1 Tax=Fannyhessea vaginae TaxID=82135 RepID=UPI0023F04727|nr:exodeoxyribonuclease VII small subunit [Fannyhessea vaginae]